MSIVKQLLVCLVLTAAATAGWLAYTKPELIGLASASTGGPQSEGRQGAPGGSRAGRVPGMVGERGAVNVVTAPVAAETGGETLIALGTAEAARSVTLFPEVTGVVTEILFKPGQTVEAGAVLLRLRDDEQQVAVDRARVNLEQAEQTLQRSRTLAKGKNITVAALTEAETAARLAEIEVRAVSVELERRSVKAPFAGVTGLTDLSLGDLVTMTNPVTTIDDLTTLQVAFEAPERWAGRVTQDQPVTATAQALPGAKFPGRITGIDSRVDATTRTLRLRAELANDGRSAEDRDGGQRRSRIRLRTAAHGSDAGRAMGPAGLVRLEDRGGGGAAGRDRHPAAPERQCRRAGRTGRGRQGCGGGDQRLRDGAAVAEVDVAPAILEKPDGGAKPAASAAGETRVRS
jgi:multidrug efflux pump subunit AcrA (membrane-fusion protein)